MSESSEETTSESLTPLSDELSGFEAAEIDEVIELTPVKIQSIVESLLFATDKAQSVLSLKSAFVGTNVKAADIRGAIQNLNLQYSGDDRGVFIEEVTGGYQVRTKPENKNFLNRLVKSKTFKLSPPALEVLSIVAYKQPCPKSMIDEVRGVESGHLMRALLDRGLLQFAGKSDLPGRPMLYETTRKFLEIFGLRNVSELPSLGEIDQLMPQGIDEATSQGAPMLSDLTGELSTAAPTSYSEGEAELASISTELQNIDLTTEFFEQEKLRQKEARDKERADDIRERLMVGEPVETKDKKWLDKYDAALAAKNAPPVSEAPPNTDVAVVVLGEVSEASESDALNAASADLELEKLVEEIAQNALNVQDLGGTSKDS